MNKFFARVQAGAVSVRGFVRLLVTLGLSACAIAQAQQKATLAWNPSLDGLTAGYFLHYGSTSLNYTNVLDVGTNTAWTVGDLQLGNNYYFAVSSYTADGTESELSGEVTLSSAPFFTGQIALGGGVQFLQFPDNNVFGFYNTANYPWIYHYDLGFEYVMDAHDQNGGVYFYDAKSGSFWFTNPSLFPYLYDFTLNSWIYYYPNPQQPNRYTTNPRYFYAFRQGKIITK